MTERRIAPLVDRKLEGYAATFNSVSRPLQLRSGRSFTEIIAPGAFATALRSAANVALLWGHDQGRVLATTKSGGLMLEEDATGLRFRAELPDTSDGRDARTLVESGIMDAMSFGFNVRRDSWSGDQRTLHDVELEEISLTHNPAYTATSAAMRSLERERDACISRLRLRIWQARNLHT